MGHGSRSEICPRGGGGGVGDAFPGDGVVEREAKGVEVKGWGALVLGERGGGGGGGGVGGVADDGVAEVLEVEADLMGATGFGEGFDEGGAVGVAGEDFEAGVGGEAGAFVDAAGAEAAGVIRYWSVAVEGIRFWVAVDAGEVGFFDLAAGKLRLQYAGEVLGLGEDHEAGGIGVESMGGAGFEGVEGLLENVVEGVAVEAAAGVHGEWGGFV